MSKDTGPRSYGLAPRGERARLNLGSRPAASGGWEQPGSSQPGAPPMSRPLIPPYRGPRREKPIWLWLLFGILLGTGGTLLSATLWLPERETRTFTRFEPDTDERQGFERARGTEPGSTRSVGERVDVSVTENLVSTAEPEATVLDVDDSTIQTDIDALPTADDLPTNDADVGATDSVLDRELEDRSAEAPVVAETIEASVVNSDADALSGPAEAVPTLESLLSNDKPFSDEGDLVGGAAVDLSKDTKRDDLTKVASIEPEATSISNTAAIESPPLVTTNGNSKGRLYRVQLAAVDNENAASAFWREVNLRLPGLFADVEPIFDERLVDERLYLRIWVGEFARRDEALGYCGFLKGKGQDCFVTRVDKL